MRMGVVQSARDRERTGKIDIQQERNLRKVIFERLIFRLEDNELVERPVESRRVALQCVIAIEGLERFALGVAIFRRRPKNGGRLVRPVELESERLQNIQPGGIAFSVRNRRSPVLGCSSS